MIYVRTAARGAFAGILVSIMCAAALLAVFAARGEIGSYSDGDGARGYYVGPVGVEHTPENGWQTWRCVDVDGLSADICDQLGWW